MTVIEELIQAYDDYIVLLTDFGNGLAPLAMVHGYQTPPEMIERGVQLRDKIASLKHEMQRCQ